MRAAAVGPQVRTHVLLLQLIQTGPCRRSCDFRAVFQLLSET